MSQERAGLFLDRAPPFTFYNSGKITTREDPPIAVATELWPLDRSMRLGSAYAIHVNVLFLYEATSSRTTSSKEYTGDLSIVCPSNGDAPPCINFSNVNEVNLRDSGDIKVSLMLGLVERKPMLFIKPLEPIRDLYYSFSAFVLTTTSDTIDG